IVGVSVHSENKAKEDGGLNTVQPTETSPYSVEELRRMSLQEFLGRMRERVITYRQLEGLYRQHGNVKRIAYVGLKEDRAAASPDHFSRCPHWSGNLPLSALNVSRRLTLITHFTYGVIPRSEETLNIYLRGRFGRISLPL